MSKKHRVLIIRILLFAGTAVSLFFVPWPIVLAWIAPLPTTVQDQVDDTVGYGFDGVIVYVHQAGQPPAYYAAGLHSRTNSVPADPHALFKIASIAKLYEAVAITKLVSAEKLSLDGTLAEYFPELANRIEYAEQITLRQMVQHRSGIPSYSNTPNFWANPPGSKEATLALALDRPATFKPGEGYEYSNTNYLLISDLIEKTLGYSKHQYFEEEILTPLGLENTFTSNKDLSKNGLDMDDIMSGYYVGFEEDLKFSDGSMLATAEDVGIFIRALNDGSVFAEGEQTIYSTIYVYGHTGLVPGYQSIAHYHPDIDTVVVQFTNTTNFSGYNWSLSEIAYNRIVDILHQQK